MKIIDGTNLILGRLASYVAKQALEGETITIINSEKVIITGKRANVFQIYKERIDRGSPLKGPYYPRQPDRIVKRVIRGMLPRKYESGRLALKRVKCYIGVREQFKNEKFLTVDSASISNLKTTKIIKLSEIVNEFGIKL
ncbi:MAG: 50S ribosomal protein L13 [Candidatus Nanoarchaeia archaeon]|nr:50S ribosomal protein L13 [Candidatus Nanoarchaeia archaeon]